MKKITVILLILFLCFGCTKKTEKDQQFIKYDELIEKLKNQSDFDQNYPFQVSLIFNRLEEQYRYDIIIDLPTTDMYELAAVAYIDDSKEETYPSLGVFDEDSYHLKVGYIDKSQGFYKGVQLSGTCQKIKPVKLYVSYYSDIQKTKQIEKYIEVKYDET